MVGQFQFVSTMNPDGRVSSETRKSNHSHVMRHVHQKKRQSKVRQLRDAAVEAKAPNDLHVLEIDPSTTRIQRHGTTRDPFSTLARPLSSEEYLLLDNYIHVVMPAAIGHCGLWTDFGDYQQEVLREWVSLAVSDPIFMTVAILLKTCRYILRNRPGDPVLTQRVLQYKQICLYSLRTELESTSYRVTNLTVAKALAFTIDEVTSGDIGNAKKHLVGIMAMLGPQGNSVARCMTGLIERMYLKFIEVFWLHTALPEGPAPASIAA